MLLDCVDFELLKLVGVYRLLPPVELQRYGFASSYEPSIRLLLSGKLLEWCGPERAALYLRLSTTGVVYLSRHGCDCPRYSGNSLKPEYTRRMIETLKLALLCRRAGIDSTQDDPDTLKCQPSFIPSAVFRGKGNQHLVSSAQCAGFGHWGNTAYMLYFASQESFGPYYNTEVKAFHNLLPRFNAGFGVTKALVLAGDSFADTYKLLQSPAEKSRSGQSNYARLCEQTRLPLHLTACNDTGAAQLALMAQPGWRERVAKLLLGSRWSPPPADLPGADGMDGGTPLSVAADLNLKRLADLCRRAWGKGYPAVAVAALKEQVDGVLARALPIEGIKLLYFEAGDLQNAFDAPLLFTPEHTGAVSPTGEAMVL